MNPNPKAYTPLFRLPINFLKALPDLLKEEDNISKLTKEVTELRNENIKLKAKLKKLQDVFADIALSTK